MKSLMVCFCVLGLSSSASCKDTSTKASTDAIADTLADVTDISLDTEISTETPTDAVTDAVPDTASDTVVITDTRVGTPTDFGLITGACGALSAPLTEATPSFHVSTWEFDSASFDPSELDTGPMQRFNNPNAGGSSICSEVMSMQYLLECEDAVFYKTETEIIYDTMGDLTDYEMIIDGNKIGVSVTRAYLGPFVMEYTVSDAAELLAKKFASINESSANVSVGDAWVKQILHIWTLHPEWADIVEDAWDAASNEDKADTVVVVTIEEGADYVVTDSCDN